MKKICHLMIVMICDAPLLQVPASRVVERHLLLRLQPLGQLIEPREARLHLLKRRVARGDAPTHVLQLLRLRCEGGQL